MLTVAVITLTVLLIIFVCLSLKIVEELGKKSQEISDLKIEKSCLEMRIALLEDKVEFYKRMKERD